VKKKVKNGETTGKKSSIVVSGKSASGRRSYLPFLRPAEIEAERGCTREKDGKEDRREAENQWGGTLIGIAIYPLRRDVKKGKS